MFINTILYNYYIAFPVKTIVCYNRSKIPSNNWFSTELQKMRETLKLLSEAYKLHGTLELKSLLLEFRRKYNIAIENAKKQANDKYIRINKNSPKAMWKLIKCKNPKKQPKQTFAITPDEFNAFFANIATDIISTLAPPKFDPISLMTNIPNINTSFNFKQVTYIQVRDAFVSLRNNNSKDIYGFTVPLIKSLKDILIQPLTNLINSCIEVNLFPDCLKRASVVPIYKKGDPDDIGNYRPISLLPIFSKIFEKLMLQQITEYLNKYNLLTLQQFGFRKGLSTSTAISALVDKIIQSFERKEYYSTHFLDLSKAFDCVTHDILLRKLYYYNFQPPSINLIMSYLKNRTQSVSIENRSSCTYSVNYGVPQGSILGPILFLLYTNDLPDYLKEVDVTLYADDTCIGTAGVTADLAFNANQNSMKKAAEWFSANRLHLNKTKCVSMLFTLRPCECSIECAEYTKYLGVIIDKELTWCQHDNYMSDKISKNTFLLRNLANNLSLNCLCMAYYALIHSLLNYSILVWGHSSSLSRLFKLQRRSIRIIANIGYREDCRAYFKSLKILTLPSLYIYRCLEFITRHTELYPKVNLYHNYRTRHEDICFRNLRLTKSRDAINYFCIKFLNTLPDEVRRYNSHDFLKNVKQYLIRRAFYSLDEYLNNNFKDLVLLSSAA